jgi:hypothetical protein
MAHSGGQVGWDDVTVIGKRGPRSGTTLKSQAVCLIFTIFFVQSKNKFILN